MVPAETLHRPRTLLLQRKHLGTTSAFIQVPAVGHNRIERLEDILTCIAEWSTMFGSNSPVVDSSLPLWFATYDNVQSLTLSTKFGGYVRQSWLINLLVGFASDGPRPSASSIQMCRLQANLTSMSLQISPSAFPIRFCIPSTGLFWYNPYIVTKFSSISRAAPWIWLVLRALGWLSLCRV